VLIKPRVIEPMEKMVENSEQVLAAVESCPAVYVVLVGIGIAKYAIFALMRCGLSIKSAINARRATYVKRTVASKLASDQSSRSVFMIRL